MYFERWDVVEAHYWFAVHYHGGQSSELYSRQCRISRYFKPSILSNGPSSENACAIYNNLELKYGHKRTHCKMLPSGDAELIRSR
jgi:hypothetical protein